MRIGFVVMLETKKMNAWKNFFPQLGFFFPNWESNIIHGAIGLANTL